MLPDAENLSQTAYIVTEEPLQNFEYINGKITSQKKCKSSKCDKNNCKPSIKDIQNRLVIAERLTERQIKVQLK